MAASQYEIRISGRLGETTLLAFEGLTAQLTPCETVLTGPLPDQAALHGSWSRSSRWAWSWSRFAGSPRRQDGERRPKIMI